MNNSTKPEPRAKSPLVFLMLMGVLVVATLVTASEFFLRPQMENALQENATINSYEPPLVEISDTGDIGTSFDTE